MTILLSGTILGSSRFVKPYCVLWFLRLAYKPYLRGSELFLIL